MHAPNLLLHTLLFSLCSAIPVEDTSSLVRRADVPNLPPASPPNANDCSFRTFTQNIDHFGQHNGTFQQKYNLVTEFFKPGGPIFFFQGEESTYLDCVESTIGYSWAKQTHGIAVSLEHRYFGESAPFNSTDPTKQQYEYSFLTLDNVMADSANFVNYLKKSISGASNSKAIVYSGSYGGFLCTVLRQNHPEAFYGAIASAPPAAGIGSDPNSEDWYTWNIWLNNVYQDASAEGSSKLKNAIQTLEQRVTSGTNLSSLQHELNLCDEPKTTDFVAINNWFQNVLSSAAELNYPIARPGRSPVAHPLNKVMTIALTEKDPIQIINQTLSLWFGSVYPCIDVNSQTALQAVVPAIQVSVFNYLCCKYYPLFALSDVPNGTIFTASSLGKYEVAQCDKKYNITTPSIPSLREKYKFTRADLRNSTHIIWSLGQYDPTNGVSPHQPGIDSPALSVDRNVSRILYTSNMGHREDLFAPDPSDRETVTKARSIELESIKGWLGWYGL
ncbi:hypothetical protein H2200_005203 [Cladophialophora chaetospira]|uniref:Serine carboxypeptidase S28-domain-containing protein n=1 Tax=Cladophialophora chaetospira TaxID=386627 RepID=A0AA39CJL4_9EURO|nr:hypothetical protein H2200_005203 [Cladophialophora chaetospira]